MRRARKDVAGITSADDAIALIHTVWPIEAATLTRLEQRVSPPSSPRQRRTAYLLCVAYRIDPAELDLSPADGPGVGVLALVQKVRKPPRNVRTGNFSMPTLVMAA